MIFKTSIFNGNDKVISGKKRLVVLASGEGTNFGALLDAQDQYQGEIVALVVDRECNAVKRAESKGIPVIKVLAKDCKDKGEFNKKLLQELENLNGHYYLLAGFMRILPPEIVRRFPKRLINIHPSLLPAFPGVDGIKKAYEYGVKYTGCTVHFVDEGVDTGPIIAQRVVAIEEGDTLETLKEKIQQLEHQLYVEVVKLLCSKKVVVNGRKVEFIKEDC
ncbi:phosphoribosylglycinamide formyltransferase-1 [Anaerobranca californiensis DSM 14826]|jgi:phosphoribosylglycinamide formyltransferase-1|uniref:Phosphoribosylglycinamide formyltransferase n=1 Tax=Anaerobranca californiensis DSM 14826 TaxID=1120989 RepID=A0A1M6PX20_9FIRM|nr:phosphoribosylglycinamide formyltransferase [Anaerobranca californiensis]SHK12499.1 phosphoribosylglycinamide formyltransferase-1 [Anaerobranca californiensis DSM 14826]